MPENRALVVQCCHLPQYVYVVDRIREKHPDWRLEGLLYPHPHLEHYLSLLPHLEVAHLLPFEASDRIPDLVILPLLNGGYPRAKKASLALGVPCWESDYRGQLHPLRKPRLYRSLVQALHKPSPEFVTYLETFPLHPMGNKVLLLESCHPSLVSKAREKWEPLISAPDALTRIVASSPRSIWHRLENKDFDGAVVFFSGEKGFAFMKCVPFLLKIPQVLIVTESGHSFYANSRELVRFVGGRVFHGISKPKPEPFILVVQTESPSSINGAISKLRQELYPRSKILLLCREDDRAHFENNPHLDKVISYASSGIGDAWNLHRQIRQLDPDLVCAIFSGRPIFRKPKLFFFCLPVRSRLVFNARLDCYFLGLRNLPWLLRKEPLHPAPDGHQDEIPQRVLLFQTEGPPTTINALRVITQPSVIPNASVAVFCSEEQRLTFQGLPRVEKIFSYRAHRPVENLLTVWRMFRWKSDVAAAILSGHPIFRKQKLLFWLVPARHRLVVNRNLDCYFLKWDTLGWLVAKPQAIRCSRMLRTLVRGLLFLPRFGYLLGWATLVKLRRALSTIDGA